MKKEDTTRGTRYGMIIDVDKCTGCGVCVAACASENNIPVMYDESDKTRNISWLEIYKLTNGKEFPNSEGLHAMR